MHIKLLLVITALLSIIACSDSTQQNTDESAKESNELSVETSKPSGLDVNNNTVKIAKGELSKREIKKAKDQQIARSLLINGEKFRLLSGVLKKGAKVLNINMHEYGTVKGGIVVVVKSDYAFEDKRFTQVEVSKIANKTFRLIHEKDNELMNFYQRLTRMTQFDVVELEIDYSAKAKKEEY